MKVILLMMMMMMMMMIIISYVLYYLTGSIRDIMTGKENQVLGEKPAPLPLCRPQIPVKQVSF
jgi:uncharacterized membrane protein (UPF0182 family)